MGNPISDTYLKSINNQLTAIFNHAYKYYGLKNNPCSKVGSIGKKHGSEMQFWTRDEYGMLQKQLGIMPVSIVLLKFCIGAAYVSVSCAH